MRSAVAFMIVILSTPWLMGQTVFIPDLQLRDALNNWAPGLVDVDGNMPTDNAGLTPDALDLFVGWSPCDLTGVESLAGLLNLRITFMDPGTELTFTSIGPSLWALNVIGYPSAALPPIAASGLERLWVFDAPQLAEVPTLPPGFKNLMVELAPGITVLPTIPSSMDSLVVTGTSITSLVVPQLNNGYVTCMDNEQLVTVDLGPGVAQVSVHACASLTELTLAPDCKRIALSYLDAFAALEPLPSNLEGLSIQFCPLIQPPMLPNGLLYFEVSDMSWPSMPVLPSGLQLLLMQSCTMDIPGALPPTLGTLHLNDCAAIDTLPPFPLSLYSLYLYDLPVTNLPALPGLLGWLEISNVPLTCLPPIPPNIGVFNMYNVPVNCLPNELVIVPMTLPLCTILESTCPEAFPVVTGIVYRDDNGNGMADAGESPIPGATVGDFDAMRYTGTDQYGRYSLPLPFGSYSITVQPNIQEVLGILPNAHSVSVDTYAQVVPQIDFGVQVDNTVHGADLYVQNDWTGAAFPGLSTAHLLYVGNLGEVKYGVEVRLSAPSWLNLVTSSPPATVQGSTYVWQLDSLAFGEERLLLAVFAIPFGMQNGTPLSLVATVLPTQDDLDPSNNVNSYGTFVGASFDPNDKQVFPTTLLPEEGMEGRTVDYRIRFQNTGTAPALRVLITDTLSADLDPSTFQLLGSSHPCTWFFRDGALHFMFDPIFLPDSTMDEENSHGHVLFKIDTRPGLSVGESIANTANIYFDLNEPVITEPCILSVELPDALAESRMGDVRLFPIPSTGVVYMQHTGTWTNAGASVVDARGAVVMERRIEGSTTAFDLRLLPRGLYTLRLQKGGRTWSERILRE